jgi:hypothetical protein
LLGIAAWLRKGLHLSRIGRGAPSMLCRVNTTDPDRKIRAPQEQILRALAKNTSKEAPEF